MHQSCTVYRALMLRQGTAGSGRRTKLSLSRLTTFSAGMDHRERGYLIMACSTWSLEERESAADEEGRGEVQE